MLKLMETLFFKLLCMTPVYEDTSDENCEIGEPIYNISCASKLDDTLDKNCEIGLPIYNISCVFKLDDTSDKNCEIGQPYIRHL